MGRKQQYKDIVVHPDSPRATLCRCGASHNQPYCDISHASIDFRAD